MKRLILALLLLAAPAWARSGGGITSSPVSTSHPSCAAGEGWLGPAPGTCTDLATQAELDAAGGGGVDGIASTATTLTFDADDDGTPELTLSDDNTNALLLLDCLGAQTGDCLRVDDGAGLKHFSVDPANNWLLSLSGAANSASFFLGETTSVYAQFQWSASPDELHLYAGNRFIVKDELRVQPNGSTTALNVNSNGIDIGDQGTKPTCDSSVRGNMWFEEGGAGVADTWEICCKNAADAYVWSASGTCS